MGGLKERKKKRGRMRQRQHHCTFHVCAKKSLRRILAVINNNGEVALQRETLTNIQCTETVHLAQPQEIHDCCSKM